MKIGIISPTFPPKVCGVGDHTYHLFNELKKTNHTPVVWTGEKNIKKIEDIIFSEFLLNFRNQKQLIDDIRERKLDVLVVQYTPTLYSRSILNGLFTLERFLLNLKKFIEPIVALIHEYHYPIELNPRGVIFGLSQAAHFYGLAHLFNGLVFSYEVASLKWQRQIPWIAHKMDWLPVGSNIDENESISHPNDVKKCDSEPIHFSDKKRLRLIHFGRAHPSHDFKLLFRTLQFINEKCDEKAHLYCIGMTAIELENIINNHNFSRIKDDVTSLGLLPSTEISRWLKKAHLVLSPFVDGISTRRGSVMAALAHGAPVATIRGYSTDNSIPWEKFLLLAYCNDGHSYLTKVLNFLKNPDLDLGLRGKQYYNEYFSWPVIAAQLTQKIRKIII